uniref:Uncharacterized protein n=1 Tax=Parascaris equorum TaxID=6256 RepID=A0A914RIK7_PAREQ
MFQFITNDGRQRRALDSSLRSIFYCTSYARQHLTLVIKLSTTTNNVRLDSSQM